MATMGYVIVILGALSVSVNLMHIQRRKAKISTRKNREYNLFHRWLLPQFFRRWAVYYVVEGIDDQLLRL